MGALFTGPAATARGFRRTGRDPATSGLNRGRGAPIGNCPPTGVDPLEALAGRAIDGGGDGRAPGGGKTIGGGVALAIFCSGGGALPRVAAVIIRPTISRPLR